MQGAISPLSLTCFPPRRYVFGVAIFNMRMHGAFRVIGGIFDSVHHFCLESLIRVGEFFYAFFIGVGYIGEPLRISRLPGTVGSYLTWISSEFIKTRFVVSLLLFQDGISNRVFTLCKAAHS